MAGVSKADADLSKGAGGDGGSNYQAIALGTDGFPDMKKLKLAESQQLGFYEELAGFLKGVEELGFFDVLDRFYNEDLLLETSVEGEPVIALTEEEGRRGSFTRSRRRKCRRSFTRSRRRWRVGGCRSHGGGG